MAVQFVTDIGQLKPGQRLGLIFTWRGSYLPVRVEALTSEVLQLVDSANGELIAVEAVLEALIVGRVLVYLQAGM